MGDFIHDRKTFGLNLCPSTEELEESKRNRAIELEKKGFLPENEGYAETMTSPQEEVEKKSTTIYNSRMFTSMSRIME